MEYWYSELHTAHRLINRGCFGVSIGKIQCRYPANNRFYWPAHAGKCVAYIEFAANSGISIFRNGRKHYSEFVVFDWNDAVELHFAECRNIAFRLKIQDLGF